MPDVYPGATYRPVPYRGLRTRQPRKAALLHTNGGGSQLFGWWQQVAAKGSTIGAQYQVFADGRAECYVDPALVVWHAFSASTWAIGIETQDDGNPKTPWTDPQMDTIARILVHHDVPAVMLTGPNPGDGVGFHEQQTAWNTSKHGCPGRTREAQIPDVLARMTALYAGTPQEDDMTPDQDAKLTEVLKRLQTLPVDVWTQRIDGPGGVHQQPAAAVLATAMSGALGAAAGSDPGAIADHLADSLGPDLAKQVLQALAAKLGQ